MGMLCCWSISLGAQDAAIDAANASVAVAAGQVIPKPAGPPPTPAHTGIKAMLKGLVTDFENLPAKENAWWAVLRGGSARSRRHCARVRPTSRLSTARSEFETGARLVTGD